MHREYTKNKNKNGISCYFSALYCVLVLKNSRKKYRKKKESKRETDNDEDGDRVKAKKTKFTFMITNGVSKILLCTRIYCYYNLSDGNSIEIHDFYRKPE